MTYSLAIVTGTRPEIIKLSPLIKICQREGIGFTLIHTNQHSSKEMYRDLYAELDLPYPDFELELAAEKKGNGYQEILAQIGPLFQKVKPQLVIVQGDTDSVLAACIAAKRLNIKVAHVEAGLRAFDGQMPEERNRITVDHLADYLFAVSEIQKENLVAEGVAESRIHIVGNTIADAVKENLSELDNNGVLERFNLESRKFVLFTAHRNFNVDSREQLIEIITLLSSLDTFQVVWPIHQRTLSKLQQFNLKTPDNVKVIDPLGYRTFLSLLRESCAVVTDSGGVQEEAFLLGVPCFTIRKSTERPETLENEANKLLDLKTSELKFFLKSANHRQENLDAFGKGHCSEKILKVLLGLPQTSKESVGTINVLGMGHIGLPLACLLAENGFDVCGIDIDRKKIEKLEGESFISPEPGLSQLLTKVRPKLTFSSGPTLADTYILCVPTPAKDDQCQVDNLIRAVQMILPVCKENSLVIVESTVSPGTIEDILLPLFVNAGKNVLLSYCPERALPGQTLWELRNNDRIIGALKQEAVEAAINIYKSFCRGKLHQTSLREAECIKLVENSYRDVNIALSNELSEILQEHKVEARKIIQLANCHPRVDILTPGPGVGGHCIPIDPRFLYHSSSSAKLLPMARKINDERPKLVAGKISKAIQGKYVNVGLLGMAYKKNTSDHRESPALRLMHELESMGYLLRWFDPYIHPSEMEGGMDSFEEIKAWAQVLIITTNHDEFDEFQFDGLIIDTRGAFKRAHFSF